VVQQSRCARLLNQIIFTPCDCSALRAFACGSKVFLLCSTFRASREKWSTLIGKYRSAEG
jgi:hypothetical protein